MLELVTFEKDDCPNLIQWVPDARFLLQWAGPRYSFPLTTEQLEETFDETRKSGADHLMFKAVDTRDREIIGHIELMRIDRKKKAAHIGRVLILRPELRGRGYGSAMISLLVDLAFNSMDMRELTLNVFDFNRQAIACYTKIGFRLYDYRESVRYNDWNWNLIAMKLTKEFWMTQMDTS